MDRDQGCVLSVLRPLDRNRRLGHERAIRSRILYRGATRLFHSEKALDELGPGTSVTRDMSGTVAQDLCPKGTSGMSRQRSFPSAGQAPINRFQPVRLGASTPSNVRYGPASAAESGRLWPPVP